MMIRNSGVASISYKTLVLLLITGTATTACVTPPIPARFVQGPITAFGSVIVNGVEYNTNDANITIDGVTAAESDLRVGMIATMGSSGVDGGHQRYRANGQNATGTTDEIIVNDEVEGEVVSSRIGPDSTGEMDVMGQAVAIGATTVFGSAVPGIDTVDQISPGMIVEVHGHTNGRGAISATRIQLKNISLNAYLLNHQNMEVKGIVSNLDSTVKTFNLGTAIIYYADANITDLNDRGGIHNDQWVKVSSDTNIGSGNRIDATRVEMKEDGQYGHQGEEDETIELHGITTATIDTNDNFEFNGERIHIDTETVMEGIQKNQITFGTDLEVKAVIKNATLTATFISAGEIADKNVTGTITTLSRTGINSGLIEVQGVTVKVNNETIMHDTGAHIDFMQNIQGLQVGDTVKIDYYTDNNNHIAVKIER